MMAWPPSVNAASWGSWVLGDLTDPLRTTIELLGPQADVDSIAIRLPSGAEVIPSVLVVVRAETEVRRLRREVESGEFVSMFDEPQPTGGWRCTVAGIRLIVARMEASS
jgi:hypothetical protein